MSDSLVDRLGVSNEAASWSVGVFFTGLSAALVASAICWPISWYHVARNRDMMENGYEEVERKGGQGTVLRKVGAKE